MKLLKILATLVLPLLIMQSCEKAEFEVPVQEGGLIEIKNPSLNYVVGNPGPYESTVRIYQGEIKVEKVDVYATFYSTRPDTVIATDEVVSTQLISNIVLFTTLKPSSPSQNSIESFSFEFDDIYSPFTIETEVYPEGVLADDVKKGATNTDLGDALPATDSEYRIGDYWSFEYHVTTTDGRTIIQNKPTKATVATRYAGSYKCLKGEYWHPSLGNYYHTDVWPAETLIESVDAKTYRVIEYIGPFDGNEWYFQIDGNIISYPLVWDGAAQLLNDQPLITCESNPADLTDVCGEPGANTVVNDDVNGKDKLIMALGYYTAGSGPRQFYQVYEKIVK